MNNDTSIHTSLQEFAAAVTAKTTQLTAGEPEDQLRAPFEGFMADVAAALGWGVTCTSEATLPNRLGRPDYAVHLDKVLVGYVEIKAPGTGADAGRFKGRNRQQFQRFSAIPNLLYTDGNEWGLYRGGERVHDIVRLSGDVAEDGKRAVAAADARGVERLVRDFLSWQPVLPTDGDKIDLKGFAALLAPLCRMLRDDVTDALQDAASPLVRLAQDWRGLLFPNATDEQFADAYAQTVAFALLLGRSEGADLQKLEDAHMALAAQHNLLSRALQVLTDPGAREELKASLELLLRVIAVAPSTGFAGQQDPWLYFYEDFLAAYDPKLRKNVGAYYTPVEVVRAQVRLVDDLLVHRLDKPLGFADAGVVTLDPATGTGTYLLGVVEHALRRIETEQGTGAVAGQATALAKNLYGFEVMVGPYAVSELRVTRALRDRGAHLPEEGTHVYLTDTLESPHTEPRQLGFILEPMAKQHRKALEIKRKTPVIVCLGNPPYDRHDAVDRNTEDNLSSYGGWVRFGDPLDAGRGVNGKGRRRGRRTAKARLERRQELSILKDFLDPAKDAGRGVQLKNLYNLYVYFWRWALWKVFEHDTARGPGVVSFITASSYLDGDAFGGMREHMRRVCDEVWILDLGGEGRGTRRSDNVFAIQTPVAIAVAARTGKAKEDEPAKVRYARIDGTRRQKLAMLDAIDGFRKVDWQDCPGEWQAVFRPAGKGDYFAWPLLTDLMPWQHSGVQLKRTWPIAPDEDTLERRWRALLRAADRSAAFRETGDRTVVGTYRAALTKEDGNGATPLSELSLGAPLPEVRRYAYRSFDRQYLVADGRLISRPRPELWRAHGERQVYVTSLLSQVLGHGPALTACALLPDLHHFPGGSGKSIVPLYRTADASEANVLPGLLEDMSRGYRRQVVPEDLLAYVYGVLAHPAFTARFSQELETRDLRVPLTRDAGLFEQVRKTGAGLLRLHTYGERFVPEGEQRGRVPRGAARCARAVPGDPTGYPEAFRYDDATRTLHVGAGEFAPVAPEVHGFEVSGLKVVQSWLKYRMKDGGGKKSSPLDAIRPERWTPGFTTELLELLWVLEATLASSPEQERLLDAVTRGPCFQADELSPVPAGMRKPPGAPAERLL